MALETNCTRSATRPCSTLSINPRLKRIGNAVMASSPKIHMALSLSRT